MNDANGPRTLRCLLVWLAATAVLSVLVTVLLPVPLSLDSAFDVLLVRLCTWALIACAVWFWGVTTIVVATALLAPAGRAPRPVRGIPAPLRRLILTACGVALTGGIAAPALATPGPVPTNGVDHSGRVVLSGLPYPGRAVSGDASLPAQTSPDPGRARPPAAQPAQRRVVVVREGDTLWSIAAACLPPEAAESDVATAWHRIYDLNRDVIGGDPDVIHPGQRLDLPHSLHLPSEGATS